MNADIITIGDEILIGHILNTNAFWLSNQLDQNGISVRQIVTVSDSKDAITAALDCSLEKSDLVVLTGGLGPTNDDVTKQALCDFFNDDLILDQTVLNDISQVFLKLNKKINHLSKQQAMIPSKSNIIRNQRGTAPAMWFKYNGKIVLSLPGVPSEMKHLMLAFIENIKETHVFKERIHELVVFKGIVESDLAELLSDWDQSLPEEITLAYLPSKGCVKLRLTAIGLDKHYLNKILNNQMTALKNLAGEYICPFQTIKIEETAAALLNQYNQTISTAESCTGGSIAAVLTSIAGSSSYFKGSIVAYVQQIKENFLDVKSELIKTEGVVSEAVVEKMASQVQQDFQTDYAIATSGFAGPKTQFDDKPVGTVCIALATPFCIISESFLFHGSRKEIIEQAKEKSLNMLVEKLEIEFSSK